jgi:hypothetical protein
MVKGKSNNRRRARVIIERRQQLNEVRILAVTG